MDRFEDKPLVPALAVACAALFLCHLGLHLLPGSFGAFATPVLLLLAAGGAVVMALRGR
jgi:hypothetical protein